MAELGGDEDDDEVVVGLGVWVDEQAVRVAAMTIPASARASSGPRLFAAIPWWVERLDGLSPRCRSATPADRRSVPPAKLAGMTLEKVGAHRVVMSSQAGGACPPEPLASAVPSRRCMAAIRERSMFTNSPLASMVTTPPWMSRPSLWVRRPSRAVTHASKRAGWAMRVGLR